LPQHLGNQPPTISFLSLKRVGLKLYARFRVCDDSGTRVTVTERDSKARVLTFTRRFAVTPRMTTVDVGPRCVSGEGAGTCPEALEGGGWGGYAAAAGVLSAPSLRAPRFQVRSPRPLRTRA